MFSFDLPIKELPVRQPRGILDQSLFSCRTHQDVCGTDRISLL